ncbi:MAG: hypothetical protein LBE50_02275 [Gallionellaceae bacterium]|jgi:hypothetical protein|nr:hypothetical protein [Gallionellaceae bacterium]
MKFYLLTGAVFGLLSPLLVCALFLIEGLFPVGFFGETITWACVLLWPSSVAIKDEIGFVDLAYLVAINVVLYSLSCFFVYIFVWLYEHIEARFFR